MYEGGDEKLVKFFHIGLPANCKTFYPRKLCHVYGNYKDLLSSIVSILGLHLQTRACSYRLLCEVRNPIPLRSMMHKFVHKNIYNLWKYIASCVIAVRQRNDILLHILVAVCKNSGHMYS